MKRGENLVKSSISVFVVVVTAGLLLTMTACTESTQEPAAENPALSTPVPAGLTRGTVLETMDSGGYTYVAIETDQGPVWAAGPPTTVKAGDVVQIPEGMLMSQFTSKTLNRTFDTLYFVNAITNLTTPATSEVAASVPAMSKPAVADVADVSVAELEEGRNIAWAYADKDSLAGQAVSLRGKVVKYNANILGWNFIHIQDGSGDVENGDNDLTVTSKATTAVGDTIVVSGTLALDKDFGAGYVFPVILEDASITTE